jgi:serine/threonine-protein kinase
VPFIVMEYVPGPNLKAIARERAPLPEAGALDIGAQIAAALDAAHGHRLVHRNVKPENVLLPDNGVLKVTDFGLARALGDAQMTVTRTVLGTAHYTSPEQTLGRPVDGRSDLYSLGVMLYELLTGRLPFVAESVVAVAWQHVHDAPTPPRQLRPDLSPAAEAVVLTALGKDPAQRFQTASEMAAALQQARSRPMTYLRTAAPPWAAPMGGDNGAGRRAPQSTATGDSAGAAEVGTGVSAHASAGAAPAAVAPSPPSPPSPVGRPAAPPAPHIARSGRSARVQTQSPAASLPRLGALLAVVLTSLAAGTWLLLRAAGIVP